MGRVVIVALVLWLIGSGAARAARRRAARGTAGRRIEGARMMVGVMALATLLLLLDMIFKPGA